MSKFDIKDYGSDLSRFEIWNLIYDRDDMIKKLTRAVSAGKKNNCIALAQMLESVIHERNEFNEACTRLVESMQGLIKENQALKGLTEHFTITAPKKKKSVVQYF